MQLIASDSTFEFHKSINMGYAHAENRKAADSSEFYVNQYHLSAYGPQDGKKE
jgi:hypothetical protein